MIIIYQILNLLLNFKSVTLVIVNLNNSIINLNWIFYKFFKFFLSKYKKEALIIDANNSSINLNNIT